MQNISSAPSSEQALKQNFFVMSDTVNEYAGLDSRNLEEMVFEEVNPFEDTSKPIIYRQKKPAFNKYILPIKQRQRDPDTSSRQGYEPMK